MTKREMRRYCAKVVYRVPDINYRNADSAIESLLVDVWDWFWKMTPRSREVVMSDNKNPAEVFLRWKFENEQKQKEQDKKLKTKVVKLLIKWWRKMWH